MLGKGICSQIDTLVVTAKLLKTIVEKQPKEPSDWVALGALTGQLGKQCMDAGLMIKTYSELAGVPNSAELFKSPFQ